MAAFCASRGAQIDEVIANRNDIEIMLNDDQRVPGIAEPQENIQENLHVLIMQTGRWLIKEVKRVPRR